MKITDLRIDGYGVLSGLELGPFAPGLSVILGPNEAGKSTLLDFLRGVLFGFPDRRHRTPFHEPLRGGRHGGAVGFVDAAGRAWHLDRHLDRRRPVLSDGEGAEHDESELAELLGRADDAVFRSVFAFGIGELANFESLDKDEVRDLVFSAGVLGAGRSAMRAVRAIGDQRAALLRVRQQDAAANALRRRLEEIDERLREARAAVATYDATRAECARLHDEALAARQDSERLHRRARELERLRTCWAPWRAREQATRHLVDLGEPKEADRRALWCETEIRALSTELSGHRERVRNAEDLATQHAGIERELGRHLEAIGRSADSRVLPPVDLDLSERVAGLGEQLATNGATRRTLDEEVARLATECTDAEEELSVEVARPLRSAEELRDAKNGLAVLATLLGSLDQLERESATARAAAMIERTGRAADRRLTELLGAVLLVAGIGLAVVAAVGHRSTTGVGVASAAAIVAGIVLSLHTSRRRRAAADEDTTAARRLELTSRVADLAQRSGLPERPEAAEVSSALVAVEDERERRRRVDELGRSFNGARRRVAEQRSRIARLEMEADETKRSLRDVAEKLELPERLAAGALARAIEDLSEAHRLIGASARVSPLIAGARAEIDAYERRVATLVERVGISLPEGDVAELLAALQAALEGALAAEAQRSALANEAAAATAVLDEALGSGREAARLADELADGAVLIWDEEAHALEAALAQADATYDTRLGAERDAARRLDELTSSQEIATLEVERHSVAADLDAALERWVTLGAASALLQRTLARYEAERQPAVISRAAELFAAVSAGRYVKLVAREDAERRHGIEAIAANGERVDAGDLSRGAAEQLYLCLRLAFAATFSERAAALPFVLDDVLVNFDPERAAAMASAIAGVARDHQVIVLTCHPHVAGYFAAAAPGVHQIELPRA